MEAFLVKLGLQVVFTFYQKNPWAILPTLICLFMPVILVIGLVTASSQGAEQFQVNSKTCDQAYVDNVNKTFENEPDDNKNANIARSQMLADCSSLIDGTNNGYMYDTTIWQQVIDLANKYDKAKEGYDQGKIDELTNLALSGTGIYLTDKDKKTFQDQVKADIKEITDGIDKKQTPSGVYKKIADYAQDKVEVSLQGYNGDFTERLLAAARSRIGEDYVLGGNWSKTGQHYCIGSLCGFDCARFVGWSLAQAQGYNTLTDAQPAQPYGSTGATAQYYKLLSMGASKIPADEAAPGDLLYIDTGNGGWGHVVIYAGVNKYQGRMVQTYLESPKPGGFVRERDAWWLGDRVQYLRVDAYAGGGGDSAVTTGAGSAPKSYAKALLPKYGWGIKDSTGTTQEQQWVCLENLWNGESSWNPSAENKSSGAYGIPQALPGSKMATVGGDWRTNYKTQIIWGLNYIRDRYSSPCNAWQQWNSRNPHWY